MGTRHLEPNALGPVAALFAIACGASGAPSAAIEPAPLAGGEATVEDNTTSAYAFPAPNLDEQGLAKHLDGDAEFAATFVAPPAPVNAGLGPLFNNNACATCHLGDGRGLPVTGGGALGSPLVVHVSVPRGTPALPGGPVPVPGIGLQLQDHATLGHVPEAAIAVRWVAEEGRYGDGEPFTLRRPGLTITTASGEMLGAEVMTSPRIPPPVFGLGLLEAIPEATILALADPDDRDGDGISGRANLVWDITRARATLGRFGWKAGAPSLFQQAASAYASNIGVSSSLFPDPSGAIEVDDEIVDTVTFYTQTLAVPRRRAHFDPEVRRGEDLFRSVGCAKCHVERLTTGEHPVAALRNQTIHPYSDLLLHNMGFELADGRPEFAASGTEWRTPPLWGIGLAHIVLSGACFLHDGRARTLEEAILWHGGEAEPSRESFRLLGARDRRALLTFLRSL